MTLAHCAVDTMIENKPRLRGRLAIRITRNSLAYDCYGTTEAEEEFNCNYELNPEYRPVLEANGLKISGESEQGNARIAELPEHRFYLVTGFLPQLSSTVERPHPLITAFIKAALDYRKSRD